MASDLACPYCEKCFGSENARWQHARTKHKGKKVAYLRPEIAREPSMGELAQEAHWNSDPELDWVRDMFEIKHPFEGI